MITNERQRHIAEANLRRFEDAIRAHDARGPTPGVDPRLDRAMRDGAASQAADLRRELQQYADLREGRIRGRTFTSLEELPTALVEARIAARLTQRELAERLGVAEQQVQRWEADRWSAVNTKRLQQVADVLGVRLQETVDYLPPAPPRDELVRRSVKAGVPKELAAKLAMEVPAQDLAGVLARGFDWDIDELLAGVPKPPPLAEPVAFKSKTGQRPEASPLVRLASTVVHITAGMATRAPGPVPPSDAVRLRSDVSDSSGVVTLPSLLRWSWTSGVAVLPMLGKGGFAASAWRIDDRPVVVLKRAYAEGAYWLFDLAHELGHVALGHLDDAAVVDVKAPLSRTTDPQEQAANRWALDLLLPDHELLIARVRELSRGSGVAFKGAVETVAGEAGLSAGLLGLVAAFELTEVGRPLDRWGSATNLAKLEGAGRPAVEAVAARRLPLDGLAQLDRELMQAVLFSTPPA
jgi:transcriptional regulator with XRE-family HTH domain